MTTSFSRAAAPPPRPSHRPLIVGIGGTPRANSSTETALRIALAATAESADIQVFAGEDLMLPLYRPGMAEENGRAAKLVGALSRCDGLVIASPAYHGSVSGLIKNALDYAEELSGLSRPYLDGVPIGLIAGAAGAQAASLTLTTLRTIAHALRGWPTPYGATIATLPGLFADGRCQDERTQRDLERVGTQVLDLVRLQRAGAAARPASPSDSELAA